MIYIITHSRHYYPAPGAEDWKLVTRDLNNARDRAQILAQEDPKYSDIYVLAIDEETLQVGDIMPVFF